MIYYKSVAPERESCRNNTLISGYISDVHCIVNRINRWSDLLHRLFLLIDDFGIHLGHLYRCMTEQFEIQCTNRPPNVSIIVANVWRAV